MLLASTSSTLIPALVTSGGVVISAGLAAFVNSNGKKRERKANELNEAWENRGKLVDSLKERMDQEVIARVQTEAKLTQVLKENAALRRRVKLLEAKGKGDTKR